MRIADTILDLVGHTPLVRLNRVGTGVRATIVAKVEAFNPSHSVKDRIALAMIEDAERDGRISPGRTTIVEATSGNTGIGLALTASAKGYQCIITMPQSVNDDLRVVLRALGATVVLTPRVRGILGALERAGELAGQLPDAFLPLQFSNESNTNAHKATTAEEIWNDTDGQVDALVAGVGTGGTLTGVATVIKPRRPHFAAIAAEPARSSVLSGGDPGAHGIQGIGPGFVPDLLNRDLIDDVIPVTDDDALSMARRLAREEGLLVGASSGAAVVAAIRYATRPECEGKLIVVVLPSMGERELSTQLFDAYRD